MTNKHKHKSLLRFNRRSFGFWLLPITIMLVAAFSLYDLDRQRYMRAKRNLINESFYEIFTLPDNLSSLSTEALYSPDEERRTEATKKLSQELSEIVNGPLAIFRTILLDENNKVVKHCENSNKHREFNSYRNNLILKTFSGMSELRIRSPKAVSKAGRLQLYYTTPQHYKPIEKLTIIYRLYALLIICLCGGLYLLLNTRWQRPLINVSNRLQETSDGTISLIQHPHSRLELGFNTMAGQALAQDVRNRLSILSQPDFKTRKRIVQETLEYICQTFPITQLSTGQVLSNHIILFESYPNTEASDASKESLLTLAKDESFEVNPLFSMEDTTQFSFAEKHEDTLIYISGQLHEGAYQRMGGKFLERTIKRLCRSIAQGILAQMQTGATMHRQRSEANMTLSHNLGHDLTNIIATSKLDLMAIAKLTESKAPLNETRASMLRDAVEGLSQSTKFLQEIVNIYRSFSHIRQPAYERHHVNILVGDFLDAFTPTVSGNITFKRELNAQPDSMIVEPRLLKLALFNLLTNAVHALRQQIDETGLLPRNQQISITSRYINDYFVIEISDNGPGIRNAEGELLTPLDLPHIFDYGYTTKEQGGEGMGLDWVRTIAVKFHNGMAEAENAPEGGAILRVGIRTMENAEAIIPDDGPSSSTTPRP